MQHPSQHYLLGVANFIATVHTYFEWAEATVTAPLLLHPGQQCAGHIMAAVDESRGSGEGKPQWQPYMYRRSAHHFLRLLS